MIRNYTLYSGCYHLTFNTHKLNHSFSQLATGSAIKKNSCGFKLVYRPKSHLVFTAVEVFSQVSKMLTLK